MYEDLLYSKFIEIYHEKPSFAVRAPGRINLIGEHTDYNEGFVLPAAIDKAIYFYANKRHDKKCFVFAYDLNDSFEFQLDQINKSDKSWANFLLGVIAELQNEGKTIESGFDLIFGGNVPLGAGLSSSAAIESGMGYLLNTMFDLNISKLELALIAQKAEHNFAGVKCGIMDMFASIHGSENQVIKLDCRDLSFKYYPFHHDNYSIFLCNSGVKHNLVESEYNRRREECEEGVRILQKAFPQVDSLRDANMYMLRSQADKMSSTIYKRCKYVIEEIERVKLACEALESDNLEYFGQKMFETHEGLQYDYEVSCPEIDFLVEKAKEFSNDKHLVLGARLMGGGFGGCTINLVQNDSIEAFQNFMIAAYQTEFQRTLQCHEVKISNGVENMESVVFSV